MGSPTAFDLEELRIKLIQNLDDAFSDFQRLYLITDYLVIVANTKNPIFYSFFLEFLDEYILLLNNFNAECISPALIKKVIINLSTIKNNIDDQESKQKFEIVYQLIVV